MTITVSATKMRLAENQIPIAPFDWIIGDKVFHCVPLQLACPNCGHASLVELPPPLLAKETDGTNVVCHPNMGGCNHGFAA
jgi:hypothetical protein